MSGGNDPPHPAYETSVRTILRHYILAPVVGIEPTTQGFGDPRSTNELHRYNKKPSEAFGLEGLRKRIFALNIIRFPYPRT